MRSTIALCSDKPVIPACIDVFRVMLGTMKFSPCRVKINNALTSNFVRVYGLNHLMEHTSPGILLVARASGWFCFYAFSPFHQELSTHIDYPAQCNKPRTHNLVSNIDTSI